MRRYIVLLLITGIVWAQTDFDKLVLKDGTTYLGEYSKTEEEIVYFKHQEAFAFQPVNINKIKTLELSDGNTIIQNGLSNSIPKASVLNRILGLGCTLVVILLAVAKNFSNSFHF